MISTLDVAFADVSARSLGWALGLPPRPALATVTVALLGGRQAELRLLGASHQVLVHGGGALLCSETVACELPGAAPMPGHSRSGGYEFRSEVQHLEPAAYAEAVDRVVTGLGTRDDVLVGHFPGVPLAITALALQVGSAQQTGWQTWHGYPQTGELVTTHTRLTHPEVS